MSVREILARPWQESDAASARQRPGLRVVPESSPQRSRVPFVVLMLGVLAVGLVGLLLVNTSLQQGSFVIHDLETTSSKLDDRHSVLEQRVAGLRAPDELARRARNLGMEPNTSPLFLRLSDGKVLGERP